MTSLALPQSLARRDFAALGAFAVGLVPAALTSANGGYFPTSWGWASLAFAWTIAMAILVDGPPRGLALVVVGSLLLFDLWTFVSVAWSPVQSSTVDAGEAALVIALGLAAFVVVVRRRLLLVAVAGLFTGIALVASYALATRLFPGGALGGEPVAGNRLFSPVGYWNGLGIYGVIGLLLALGLLTRLAAGWRVLVGLALPLIATTVYFTYSRGAAIAFAAGLCVAFALDPGRISWLFRTAAMAVPSVIAVVLASRSSALTSVGASAHSVITQGHRLALFVVLLACVSGAIAAIPTRLVEPGARVARATTWIVAAAALVAIVVGLVAVGGPSGIWDKFKAPPPTTNGHLNKRLFSFSGSARTPLWSIAVDEVQDHPVLGGGAGSYESYYLARRTDASKVRNAHNLYLETLAELGPIGLVLLLLALLPPLGVAVRARRTPLVPALAAAYFAVLLHMTIDWDWQLTGVAVTALACGAAILVAERDEEPPAARALSASALTLAAVAVVVSFVVLVGNLHLGRASAAADSGNWTRSAAQARAARSWAPWSSEPLRLLGEAQLAVGQNRNAAKNFHKAIAKNRDDWNLWFDLARATDGKAQRAALAHAARLDPRAPEIAELRTEIAGQPKIDVTGK